MCVFTRRTYTHSSLVQPLLTILSLYQVVVQTKHARNEKHFNSTKRNNIKRRIRAIYFYWYNNTRSSPADVKQNKRSRVHHRKIQPFSNYLPFENYASFGNYPDAADVIIRYNRSRKITSSKIQYFFNFSLVSLSIPPRSRRGAQRIRKGEGRWSRPPKTFTRWSRPPKTFSCFIRSSPADVKQNKQTITSMPPQNSKH